MKRKRSSYSLSSYIKTLKELVEWSKTKKDIGGDKNGKRNNE